MAAKDTPFCGIEVQTNPKKENGFASSIEGRLSVRSVSRLPARQQTLAIQLLVIVTAAIASLSFTGCTGIAKENSSGNSGGNFNPTAVSLTTQPTNQAVTVGQAATFGVTASGTAPLTYQWQKNGVNISGAMAASYTTPPTTAADNGTKFDVVVSNSVASVTSSSATLTVNAATAAPTIATQPANQSVTAGQTATFSVTANGAGSLTYQWRKNAVNISGATSASYTTPPTAATDNGAAFDVVVSNSFGSAMSNSAALTVNPATTASNNVSPGSNLALIVQNSPSGTTFNFAAGVYRLSQPIVPKDHDIFIGASGLATTLRGSVVVSSFTHQGSYWVASLPDVYSNPVCTTAGCSCQPGYPACNLSEDLFFDNNLWQRVLALSDVAADKWYWDLKAGKVYLADDPVGHAVEVSVASGAFAGAASSVTINGLVVERFAGQAIYPRIQGGQWSDGWVIENSVIRFNHLAGITLANRMQVLNNTICDNGKLGISGGGDSDLVQGNEICRNNYAGFLGNRGGAKFDAATSLVVRSNYVHDNRGAGLHTDSGSVNTLYEYNHTTRNQGPGIDHEISHAATIRYNLIENDAQDPTGMSVAHGAGIWIYASDNVDVYGNTVTNSVNGIAGYQTLRNDNLGTHYLANLSVHDNSITQQSGTAAGILANTDSHYYPMIFTTWNNHFDNNTYCLTNSSANSYDWNLETVAKAVWEPVFLQDVHSVWTCPASPTTTSQQ